MSLQRLLIRNGFVVSMDPDVGDVPYGDVLVEDGKIAEVGRGLEASEAEQIDATGMIVMPGFVDTHRHTWQTPVRGVLPCCTLDHYFAVMLGSVGGHYRPEDVQLSLATPDTPAGSSPTAQVERILPTRPLARITLGSDPPIAALMLHRDIDRLQLTAGEVTKINLPPGSVRVFQTP